MHCIAFLMSSIFFKVIRDHKTPQPTVTPALQFVNTSGLDFRVFLFTLFSPWLIWFADALDGYAAAPHGCMLQCMAFFQNIVC